MSLLIVIAILALLAHQFRQDAKVGFSSFSEGWESPRCDGRLEVHWIMGDSRRLMIEYDKDRDGTFDQQFGGELAESFLRDLERPERSIVEVPQLW